MKRRRRLSLVLLLARAPRLPAPRPTANPNVIVVGMHERAEQPRSAHRHRRYVAEDSSS